MIGCKPGDGATTTAGCCGCGVDPADAVLVCMLERAGRVDATFGGSSLLFLESVAGELAVAACGCSGVLVAIANTDFAVPFALIGAVAGGWNGGLSTNSSAITLTRAIVKRILPKTLSISSSVDTLLC